MGSRYPREKLAEAVAASRTLSEALERLGAGSNSGTRKYVRDRIRSFGIDTSHLEREGVKHTEQRLREAVTASRSIRETVCRLGINPVGGNQAHIGRKIARFGIDISHFTHNVRSGPRTTTRELLTLGSPDTGRQPGSRLRRALLRTGVPEECGMCGTGPVWCGGPLRLEVDHVNGDWWDNRPVNLQLLCPNCHSTTDTYRGRKRWRLS